MEYDFTRCNNLQFKAKGDEGPITGYLKVSKEGPVYVYTDCAGNDYDDGLQLTIKVWETCKENIEEFSKWAEYYALEIITRDPETYTDWKVGDCVMDKETGCIYTIAAKLGDIVFLLNDNNAVTSTCTDMLTKYYTLILTDYEQELLKAQKEKCPFKNGDRVLVRDNNNAPWQHDIFYFYEEESSHPYCCQKGQVKQCIPFNEHTWQLLDTTDEYKEEEYMNENINLCEILKDCPIGTKFWSSVWGDVFFNGIKEGMICITVLLAQETEEFLLLKTGKFYNIEDAECIIFPSKDQRDWSKFEVPIKRFDPKEFKSFDKVLIRDEARFKWLPSFLGRISKGLSGKFGS